MDEDIVYSREVFIAYSKSRLLDYIENQADQVVRLQTRFRGSLFNNWLCILVWSHRLPD